MAAAPAADCSRRVAVVGGGVGGVLTLKRLLQLGLKPTLFEARDTLGGVWAEGSALMYDSLYANTPRTWLAFSDFDFPAGEEPFPHYTELVRQVQGYIDAYGLAAHAELNARVEAVRLTESGSFEIDVGGQTRAFDAVVLATGQFHAPKVPDSVSVGDGTIAFHSADLQRRSHAMAGSHVVVVGCGTASATDVVDCAIAQGAKSVTVVSEKPVYLLPRLNEQGEPFSKAAKLFHPLVPDAATVQAVRKITHGFPKGAPPWSFDERVATTWRMHELLRDRTVTLRIGALRSCSRGVATLDDGTTIDADVVVWCTGYESGTLKLLTPPLRAHVESALPLYEAVWVPTVPRLAVLGHGVSFWWTLELQAQWVSRVLAGAAALPSAAAMERWVRAQAAHEARMARKRPQPWKLKGSVLAYGLRLALKSRGWRLLLAMICNWSRTFEPRMLTTV